MRIAIKITYTILQILLIICMGMTAKKSEDKGTAYALMVYLISLTFALWG